MGQLQSKSQKIRKLNRTQSSIEARQSDRMKTNGMKRPTDKVQVLSATTYDFPAQHSSLQAHNATDTPLKGSAQGKFQFSPSYKQSMASTASGRYESRPPMRTPISEQTTQSSKDTSVVVAGRFTLRNKLGKGSFGVTYEALDNESGKRIALKLERKREGSSSNNREIDILKKLVECKRVPMLLWNGSYKHYKVMAMQMEGDNLCTLFDNNKRCFSLYTTAHIGIEILHCMEALHSYGVVHRDIKPQNFIIGIEEPRRLFVIDFGLSSWFLSGNGSHIHFQENCSPVGTARYASLNNHRGIHQTRRDDLESIAYMLIYFLRGELPWQGLRENDRVKKWKKIEQRKASISTLELTTGIPPEFGYFLDYVKKLDYYHKPDYAKLRKIFTKMRDNRLPQNSEDCVLDWLREDGLLTH